MRVAATPGYRAACGRGRPAAAAPCGRSRGPPTVRLTRRVVRSSSCTPSASSSFSMRRLKAGCETCSASAALRKLLSSATARKACRSLRLKLIAMAPVPSMQFTDPQCASIILNMQFTEVHPIEDHTLAEQNRHLARSRFTSTGVDKTCSFPSLSFFGAVALAARPCLRQRARRLSRESRSPSWCRPPPAAPTTRWRASSARPCRPSSSSRHRRQQGGRQRRDRQRVRHARRARRLHADAGLHRDARHEPGAAEAALRPGQGLRAGRHGRLVGHADGGEPDRQGQATPRKSWRCSRPQPDKISYASAGNGTAPHFAAEMFKLSTGTSMLHVPYKGSAPAITDTIGGQTQVMFPSLFTAMPVRQGRQAEGGGRCRREALGADARRADAPGAGHRRRRRLAVVRDLRAGEDARGR